MSAVRAKGRGRAADRVGEDGGCPAAVGPEKAFQKSRKCSAKLLC